MSRLMEFKWEPWLMALVDGWISRWGRRSPTREQWLQVHLIAHRGDHDNVRILENTLPAFDRAVNAGLWGIEMDVRWTRDHQPVIFHDHDLSRMFHCPQSLSGLTLAELKQRFPQVPTLAQVIARYGRRIHLMLEVKPAAHVPAGKRDYLLDQHLQELKAGRDYHLLALDLPLLRELPGLPPRAKLPIAYLRISYLARYILREKYGGLCGHYLLLAYHPAVRPIRRMKRTGMGFADTWPVLKWIAARDGNWIFSNQAVALEKRRQVLLTQID